MQIKSHLWAVITKLSNCIFHFAVLYKKIIKESGQEATNQPVKLEELWLPNSVDLTQQNFGSAIGEILKHKTEILSKLFKLYTLTQNEEIKKEIHDLYFLCADVTHELVSK